MSRLDRKGASMYITQDDQVKMAELLNEYLLLSEDGTKITQRTNMIMDKLFSRYFDKIIR